jgi:hypothetical protein
LTTRAVDASEATAHLPRSDAAPARPAQNDTTMSLQNRFSTRRYRSANADDSAVVARVLPAPQRQLSRFKCPLPARSNVGIGSIALSSGRFQRRGRTAASARWQSSNDGCWQQRTRHPLKRRAVCPLPRPPVAVRVSRSRLRGAAQQHRLRLVRYRWGSLRLRVRSRPPEVRAFERRIVA